ncbi:MAG: MBL fold metallo-hydrolase [Eubacteriales bacterium]|nr:MBL fold metallo-hydrolase [Eubacteriales bacterium]
MIITALIENTSNNKDLKAEHGLSLYINQGKRKILFDTGASGAFAENAAQMKIDLSDVELMVLSHGHYDHGGGLKTFLKENSKAKIYLHSNAFGDFYSNKQNGQTSYIGLDPTLLPDNRFVFTRGVMNLEDGAELFSDIEGTEFCPSGNSDLLVKTEEGYRQDDFCHEQNLILRENGKTVLIAGCAHNGIVNILERFREKEGCFPDVVIGGFHLYNRSFDRNESPELVAEIGKYLSATGAKYYTCHCTGTVSYNQLKTLMGEQIDYLSTGSQLTI